MKVLFAIVLAFLLTPSFSFKAKAQTADTTYWWNDDVFYEAFVRSFYDTNNDGIGDFNGLTAKLSYLQSLGVDAVWLMPVCPSPSYHGYDISNYKALNPQYGTEQEYINFVKAAHAVGIKVIFDAVMNHTSNEHPWFTKSSANNATYRDYYRWSSTNPGYNGWNQYSKGNYYYGIFCSCMPDINYYNTVVKDSMFTVIDFWLDSMHVDGFRCDAAPYIFESDQYEVNCPETLSFWQDFRTRYKSDNPNAMAVGEVWMSDDTILEYSTNNRFDFCFEFNLASDIIGAIQGGNTQNLISNFQWRYDNFPFAQYGTFLSNHDQDRVMSVLNNNVAEEKEGAAIYMTLPGIPFVYYGEEIGMDGTGDDQYKRTPMQWTTGSNSGFSSVTPWESLNTNYGTYNVETEQPDSNSILNWYKKLISIRHNNACLRRGTYHSATTPNSAIYSYVRSYQGQTLLMVINTGNAVSFTLNLTGCGISDGPMDLTDILSKNSTSTIITGQVTSTISMPANSASIFQLSTATGINNITPKDIVTAYPNPVSTQLNIDFSSIPEGSFTFDISDEQGRQVKTLQVTKSDLMHPMDVSYLASGLYTIHIYNGTVSKIFKIVKIQ